MSPDDPPRRYHRTEGRAVDLPSPGPTELAALRALDAAGDEGADRATIEARLGDVQRARTVEAERLLNLYARGALVTGEHFGREHAARVQTELARLRARTHEIQAQEMAKRAALDAEIAEWRQRYEAAKQWTEDAGLRAEWAVDPSHPFWGMTSHNGRSALLRLVTERNQARAEAARLRDALGGLIRTEYRDWSGKEMHPDDVASYVDDYAAPDREDPR